MKYLFLIIAVVLSLAGYATYRSYPDVTSKVPVIYWVTDANPARIEQVKTFHKWLIKHGYTTKDGSPVVELRLDTGNRETAKQLIQGVSGVGGDTMDIGDALLPFFQSAGLLADVTDAAKELHFDPSYTFPAIAPVLSLEGRQYIFPCNVAAPQLWVNLATFKRFKQPSPPKRWTLDEFEARGKAFVEAANEPGKRQLYFFCNYIPFTNLLRSKGVSELNETLTKSNLDKPEAAEILARINKWTYEDHILPSAIDMASFDTASGYGGASFQLFNQGNFAMVLSGRYALIQFRKFGDLDLDVVEYPHGGFPNTSIGTRAAAVYAGGKNKKYAYLFLSYLASEDYNMQIVKDADALPPNPAYTKIEAFLHPPEHPNEWRAHEQFVKAANTIAIARSSSPFVLSAITGRLTAAMQQSVGSQRYTPKEAAAMTAKKINNEIQRSITENPKLKPLYDKRVALQEKIETYRAQGKVVPLEWISNIFYRRYYVAKGWAK